MNAKGIKKAWERFDEIECFVLTSTFRIFKARMKEGSIKFDEDSETISCEDKAGMTSFLVDINDIDMVVFNNGNELNSNFPL
jgi:hypothetical protein